MIAQHTKPAVQAGTTATLKEVFSLFGLEMEDLEYMAFDSLLPAMCLHGCTVEPDGHCEHGNESILLFLNMI